MRSASKLLSAGGRTFCRESKTTALTESDPRAPPNGFDDLRSFIRASKTTFRNAIDSAQPSEEGHATVYTDSYAKLNSGITMLNRQISGQLKRNEVVAKMLVNVADKLATSGETIRTEPFMTKGEAMKRTWDDVCNEMSKRCTELEDKDGVCKREKDEINVIVKTIVNKGTSAAKEIQNRIEVLSETDEEDK
ncbi:uncharacterized protein LOC106670798 [Cimex lectularius]|uniref:Uncharacterized protein n=1 Tax=Cimex lectularius TaxID=79782 RepID=A0A8I6S4C2_CIMLE|nr:uncharacterized protein LOC106670798 [Cimex lectularius]